jgi:hypothetical protein
MGFPKLPFKLSTDENKTDAALLKDLRKEPPSFIQSDTKKILDKLQLKSLRGQHDKLLDLWPRLLTDALRCLKQNDPREWDRSRKGVSYASFFHEGSLGVDQLRKVLENFARFEGMLYGASPDRYRDHIAHAFRVWLIGQAILVSDKCFDGKLCETDTVGEGIATEEWQCMWAIAALCHDLGYPLSHIDRINSLAREALQGMGLVHGGDLRFTFSQQLLPFHDTVMKLMASRPVSLSGEGGFTTHLQNKYYMKLLKSLDELAHGVVSSVLLSKALVYFLESDLSHDSRSPLKEEDARQFVIRREILRAIAGHTCQDIYHLQFDSLAFLLYMIDEVQCWGRPTLEELQHDVTGIGEGEAEVRFFEPHRVAVVIWTGDEAWSQKQTQAAHGQLSKLYRMLRLGVGTAVLKDKYLEFAVMPKEGRGVRLLLKGGKIKLTRVPKSKLDSNVSAAK